MSSMKIPGRLSPLIVSLATVLAGCSSDGSTTMALQARIDTVNGVERLTYPESGATPLSWSVDTAFVLGGFETEDSEYQFGGLTRTSLAGTEDSRLYVLDAEGVRVLGYGSDGSFLGSWSREGSGPGELGGGFRGPSAMALGPGDTLWIHDRSNQRFTLIDVLEGETASLPLPESVRGIGGQMSVDSSGVVLVLTNPSIRAVSAAAEASGPPLVRLSRQGEPADTFWTAPPPEREIVRIPAGQGRTMMIMVAPVFAPGFSWVRFDDGGFAIQEAAEYEIHFLDEEGNRRRLVRREPPPRPVTEEDRQRHLDSLLAPPAEETPFTSRTAREARAEATTFADVMPRIVTLRRDTHDRLWVGVSEGEPGVIDRIDVYDSEGELLGELRGLPMPDHFYGERYAAIIDRDELDVQRIRVIRLREQPE